jgi:hypothetical protein
MQAYASRSVRQPRTYVRCGCVRCGEALHPQGLHTLTSRCARKRSVLAPHLTCTRPQGPQGAGSCETVGVGASSAPIATGFSTLHLSHPSDTVVGWWHSRLRRVTPPPTAPAYGRLGPDQPEGSSARQEVGQPGVSGMLPHSSWPASSRREAPQAPTWLGKGKILSPHGVRTGISLHWWASHGRYHCGASPPQALMGARPGLT